MAALVIANWKMKLGLDESRLLAQAVKKIPTGSTEVVICPSFPSLATVSAVLARSRFALGAQDCFWEPHGAYTGAVSPETLHEIGCRYVIVGHSERRQYLGETDEMVHRKVAAALSAGLVPIICVGETFEQRQTGHQDYALIQQTSRALEGIALTEDQQLIVAYEPVWVIGTGQAINPDQAQTAHQVIRQTLIDLFPLTLVTENIRIIYGGSVDSGNVADFVRLEHTAGVLVGNASLDAGAFAALIRSV